MALAQQEHLMEGASILNINDNNLLRENMGRTGWANQRMVPSFLDNPKHQSSTDIKKNKTTEFSKLWSKRKNDDRSLNELTPFQYKLGRVDTRNMLQKASSNRPEAHESKIFTRKGLVKSLENSKSRDILNSQGVLSNSNIYEPRDQKRLAKDRKGAHRNTRFILEKVGKGIADKKSNQQGGIDVTSVENDSLKDDRNYDTISVAKRTFLSSLREERLEGVSSPIKRKSTDRFYHYKGNRKSDAKKMDIGQSLDSLEKIDVVKKYPWISGKLEGIKKSRVEKTMKRTFGFMKVLEPEFQFKDRTMSHMAKQLNFCDGCTYHEDTEESRVVQEEIEPLERFIDLDAMKIEDANSQASSDQ